MTIHVTSEGLSITTSGLNSDDLKLLSTQLLLYLSFSWHSYEHTDADVQIIIHGNLGLPVSVSDHALFYLPWFHILHHYPVIEIVQLLHFSDVFLSIATCKSKNMSEQQLSQHLSLSYSAQTRRCKEGGADQEVQTRRCRPGVQTRRCCQSVTEETVIKSLLDFSLDSYWGTTDWWLLLFCKCRNGEIDCFSSADQGVTWEGLHFLFSSQSLFLSIS